MCREGLRARLAGTQAQGRQAGSDPPRPRVLIADHCSSPLALADTVDSVVSKTPPPPKSPQDERAGWGKKRGGPDTKNGWSCRDTGPVRLRLLALGFQRRRRGSWFIVSRFTGKDRRGGGAEGGRTRRDHSGFSCRDVPWCLHTHMDPPSLVGGGARNSFVAVPHRAGKAVKVKRECVQAALVGRQKTRACCLLPGSLPEAHPADAKGSSVLLSRATICPLTTRGGVGRRDA